MKEYTLEEVRAEAEAMMEEKRSEEEEIRLFRRRQQLLRDKCTDVIERMYPGVNYSVRLEEVNKLYNRILNKESNPKTYLTKESIKGEMRNEIDHARKTFAA